MKFKDLLNAQEKKQVKDLTKSKVQEQTTGQNTQQTQQNKAVTPEEIDINFQQAMSGIKPIQQDKVTFSAQNKKVKSKQEKLNNKQAQQEAEFYFSDQFEPNLEQAGPMKYVREDISGYEAKRLRRGDYAPEIMLDLHGLKQEQAKLEIAGLIHECHKKHIQCACIVHGLGGYVLKQKVPHWLVQHPKVQAFHQAPLEWGGDGALLVLFDVNDDSFSF
jgi:DNA-nicking Smr family endonuclease